MLRKTGCGCAALKSCNSWCARIIARCRHSISRWVISSRNASSTPNGSTAASQHRNRIPRQAGMTISDRVRVKNVRILSDDYYVLKTTTFEYRRANGDWQTQQRETYDRGNCATVLPYNLAQRTVVLVRQFRYPAYVNGYDDLLIEAAAGVLDNESPEVRIRAEAEEEIGYRLRDIMKIFEAFMRPRSVTRKPDLLVAGYDSSIPIRS